MTKNKEHVDDCCVCVGRVLVVLVWCVVLDVDDGLILGTIDGYIVG